MPKGKQGFQKGNQLSVGKGRPPLTAEQRAMRLASRNDVRSAMIKYSTLTVPEISEMIDKGDLPVVDVAILRKLLNSAQYGDSDGVDWTLDHIMGKRATKTETTVKQHEHLDISQFSSDELEQMKTIIERQQEIRAPYEDY